MFCFFSLFLTIALHLHWFLSLATIYLVWTLAVLSRSLRIWIAYLCVHVFFVCAWLFATDPSLFLFNIGFGFYGPCVAFFCWQMNCANNNMIELLSFLATRRAKAAKKIDNKKSTKLSKRCVCMSNKMEKKYPTWNYHCLVLCDYWWWLLGELTFIAQQIVHIFDVLLVIVYFCVLLYLCMFGSVCVRVSVCFFVFALVFAVDFALCNRDWFERRSHTSEFQVLLLPLRKR